MQEITKALVIGGAGNLGASIVELLLQRGVPVCSFDLVPYEGDGDVHSFIGDITDPQSVERAMDGVSTVFHTASIIDIRPNPTLLMQRVNVDGTFNVIQACKKAGVSTLVYTSSLEVISGFDENGRLLKVQSADESTPIAAVHHLPYATTKAAAERLVLAAHSPAPGGLKTVSIRPGYIMGAGCIGTALEMARARKRRDYYVTARVPSNISTVHPKNCALAQIAAAERICLEGVGGTAFFCRDFEANVIDMALEVFNDTPIKSVLLPLWLAYAAALIMTLTDNILHYIWKTFFGRVWKTSTDVIDVKALNMAWIDIVVSDEKARKLLGYKSVVSKAECMAETITWANEYYLELGP
jgi:nucleoside-diphosphate-sugar epimerase